MNHSRPFFRHLPPWIYASPKYRSLPSAERWALHMIAGRCKKSVDDDAASIRGCYCGPSLYTLIGVSERTFRRMLSRLRRSGLVVKLAQGGGQGIGNELGVAGERGALDALEVGDDQRYMQPPQTVTDCHGNTVTDCPRHRDRLSAEPCQDVTLLSSSSLTPSSDYLPSSSLNGENEDLKAGRRNERGDDDDDGLLSDNSGQDQIARFLNDHLGIDVGRARKQAEHPRMSPALARGVAAKGRGQQIARPGGYFGNLIDDALAEAATSHHRRQREQADAAHRELADAKEAIRDPARVPDAELAALAERCQLTDFAGGLDALRVDPAFSNELARAWLAQDRKKQWSP